MLEIAFAEAKLPQSGVVALTLAEGAAPAGLAAALDQALDGALSRAIAAAEFTGKKGQCVDLIAPGGYRRVMVLGAGKTERLDALAAEELGAAVQAALAKEAEVTLLADELSAEHAALAGLGARLRAYRFDKYRTTQKPEEKPKLLRLTLLVGEPDKAEAAFEPLEAVAAGVEITRDLVSEPGNVLYPEAFADRIEGLKKLGLKIEVFDQKELEKLGFGSLLSVSRGSAREPRMVVIQWPGASNKDKDKDEGKKHRKLKDPIAFIGKGVTFDSGGISIKPAAGMENMKWDMAGAGTVVGLMAALAGRHAKVDAVGLVGLVENMPSGTASRPGDVVKSYSGQTIEILNTDAEGRLVLADVLYYAQERFAPKYMIDLATLTGAILISLGDECAGLFSNDDGLSEMLEAAGKATGEMLWRMPLAPPGERYDKNLNSPIADVQNISSGKGAGSITAAQFLQRFVNGKPWAHLDIAGMAWASKDGPLVPKGATAFGVRLLNRLVAEHFEAISQE